MRSWESDFDRDLEQRGVYGYPVFDYPHETDDEEPDDWRDTIEREERENAG